MKRGKRICNTLKDVRIQFTNGSVTEYVYIATWQKLGVEYRVAAPNTKMPKWSKSLVLGPFPGATGHKNRPLGLRVSQFSRPMPKMAA